MKKLMKVGNGGGNGSGSLQRNTMAMGRLNGCKVNPLRERAPGTSELGMEEPKIESGNQCM